MIDHEAVKQEILNFVRGEEGFKQFIEWYKTKKHIFPLIVEDGIPISINLHYGMAIRNHINKVFHIVPNEINDWAKYEDYIYYLMENMILDRITKEENNNDK